MEDDKFETWLQNGLISSEIVDPSYPVSGASSWFPHGYHLANNVLNAAASELESIGYGEIGLPSFVSIEHFRQQAENIKSFLDRVYLARPSGCEEPQVIKSTIEAQISPIFARWLEKGQSPPFRVYTRRSVGRYEMGKTSPLWKERLVWPFFEAHCATATGVETEIQRLDQATHAFCHEVCMPVISVERLKTNRRLQEYANRRIEAITIMPSGFITILTSIYDLGDRFSRVYGVGDRDLGYLNMVNFAFSGRLILAMIGHNFREDGPIYPPRVAPFQFAVIPIRGDDSEIHEFALSIYKLLSSAGYRGVLISGKESFRRRSRQASAFGVPLHLFVGHQEIETESVKIVSPSDKSVNFISIQDLQIDLDKRLSDIQEQLLRSNFSQSNARVVALETKEEVKEAITLKKTVTTWLCSDQACISILTETGGEIIGRLNQEPSSKIKCVICQQKPTQTILIGRKYRGEK